MHRGRQSAINGARVVLASLFLVAGALGMASGANAATLIGAKVIHITSGLNSYIQVAEVVAVQAGTGSDVALASKGGTASALNQFAGSTGPANAIDGVYPSSYPNIYHSVGGTSDYLDVTLASPSDLSSLTIYGRLDGGQDRDVYGVSIFNMAGARIYSGVLDGRLAGGHGTTVVFSAGVPEPAAWAFILLGIGALGVAMRRARRAQLTALRAA